MKLSAAICLLPLLSSPLALAQETPTPSPASRPIIDPDAPNLVHGRHLHAHNPAHDKVAPGSPRFTTSRSDALKLPLPAEKDAFTFVVFGDRTSGPANGVNVLADAVRDTNLLEPDLVLTVGDLIQGYNSEPDWVKQAREYRTIMDKLLCPWFPVAGNHDVYWRDTAKTGEPKPQGENESKFEKHFGPLWYAFEHKKSWFIVLYSDEGNKQTNEKSFSKPELQEISDEQFAWLKETLAKAKGAEHVFLFLHHPRWIGGNNAHEGYGDKWDEVHQELVKAGNVTAVFGGHIHRMRYDQKDGIEYVTLAATGGSIAEQLPAAGWLHHYHVITVRKSQVAMASFPVGTAINVREMTKDLVDQVAALSRTRPAFDAPLPLGVDGAAQRTLQVTLKNPTNRAVEYTLTPESRDSRWVVMPDHAHITVPAGEEKVLPFRVERVAAAYDGSLRPLTFSVEAEYLTDTNRYPVPARDVAVPLDFSQVPSQEMYLKLDGKTAPTVPANLIKDADGRKAFTLECRFRARSFKDRNGLIGRMQGSGHGIFVNNGRVSSSVHMGDKYLGISAPRGNVLETNHWYHVAQVWDGQEHRLYIDGKLVAKAEKAAGQTFKDNDLPLVLGGDVESNGDPMDTLDGDIDDIRLSKVARYTADFTPATAGIDADTVLLLDFNRNIGRFLQDNSPQRLLLPFPLGLTFEKN